MVFAIESKFSAFSPPPRIFDFQTAEFLPAGQTNNHFSRQISLGVSLNYSDTSLPALYAGAKPGSLMLTRPPVVFVHGIMVMEALYQRNLWDVWWAQKYRRIAA